MNPNPGLARELYAVALKHERAGERTLGALTSVSYLNASENPLVTLSEAMDLRSNPLRALPAELVTLPALEKLDLRWTGLAPPVGLRERGCVVLV